MCCFLFNNSIHATPMLNLSCTRASPRNVGKPNHNLLVCFYNFVKQAFKSFTFWFPLHENKVSSCAALVAGFDATSFNIPADKFIIQRTVRQI